MGIIGTPFFLSLSSARPTPCSRPATRSTREAFCFYEMNLLNFGSTPILRYDGAIWSPMDTLSAIVTSIAKFQGSLYIGAEPAGSPGPSRGALSMGSRTLVAGWIDGILVTVCRRDRDGGSRRQAHRWGTIREDRGIPALNVAAWDGASWQPLGYGLATYPDRLGGLTEWNGELVAAGVFTNLPGGSAPAAIWDGSLWHGLGALDGFPYTIKSVRGRLFIGGWFGSAKNLRRTPGVGRNELVARGIRLERARLFYR